MRIKENYTFCVVSTALPFELCDCVIVCIYVAPTKYNYVSLVQTKENLYSPLALGEYILSIVMYIDSVTATLHDVTIVFNSMYMNSVACIHCLQGFIAFT